MTSPAVAAAAAALVDVRHTPYWLDGPAADVSPALTTVRLPMAEIGAAAMALLLEPSRAEPRLIATSHRLVVRQSAAPPRRRDGEASG